MVRLCGASLGFFAFAVTLLLGLMAGNPIQTILGRAISALFVFCGIGLLTGWVANRILDEHAIRRHREMFPEEPESPPTPPNETQQSGESAAA